MVWQSADAHSGIVVGEPAHRVLHPWRGDGLAHQWAVHAELRIENSYVFTDSTNSD
ncbi:MAG: hypothetical protein IPI07_18865 [Flavobacteriales bacterium]|nr:hypothetical protein [Flavobacteriales bacterium]